MPGSLDLCLPGVAPPVVRVLPVPRSEPPTDDELCRELCRGHRVGIWSAVVAGQPVGEPTGDGPAETVRTLLSDRHAPVRVPAHPVGSAPVPGPVRTPRPSAVREATMRFLGTFLEVTGGFRPLAHLRRFCRADRFDDICAHLTGGAGTSGPPMRGAAAHAGRLVVVGRTPTGAPPRAPRMAQRGPGDRLTVRRVQICQVSRQAAEVVVVVSRRGASAAMALRMEQTVDRWLCAHLEIV